uniref:Ribosome production factor 2 homolog n=1 Tax=Polytomella parva TaxID=51329 RepID=A0A7S0V4Q9_9CHLO|mmetsp:Transcript_30233/g.55233  ORF Transcript_30233/g.55233 Transcript_30233/m.55233 type:complete len:337 (+) Transcript_30233:66-1076(+)
MVASTKGKDKPTDKLKALKTQSGVKERKSLTRRGKRFLENRAPKLVEDAKRILLLYGNNTSQVVKDALTDIQRMKKMESTKYTRKNSEVRPFEAGGETSLEHYCRKADCGLFALASHTKKRPHNLTLGRVFDFHLYDALELGVDDLKTITDFGRAGTKAQLGNKPLIAFVGEKFESVPVMKQAKSILLDTFRGEQALRLNLAGVDRIVFAIAVSDTHLQLRQYSIRFKKSGTSLPRVAVEEMGPRMALSVRRVRAASADMEKEAMKKPAVEKKKQKNVGSDLLDGKVGRIYMPKQEVVKMSLAKYKGTKRVRREATAERKRKIKSGETQPAKKQRV